MFTNTYHIVLFNAVFTNTYHIALFNAVYTNTHPHRQNATMKSFMKSTGLYTTQLPTCTAGNGHPSAHGLRLHTIQLSMSVSGRSISSPPWHLPRPILLHHPAVFIFFLFLVLVLQEISKHVFSCHHMVQHDRCVCGDGRATQCMGGC